VCGAKTAGFKTTGFEPPNPVSETELPTSDCGAATVHRRRGFGGTHPHHRGKHGWKLYQAGSHENCLAQNSFSVNLVRPVLGPEYVISESTRDANLATMKNEKHMYPIPYTLCQNR